MNLPETGVFDLSWTAVTGVSGYKIDIFENDSIRSKVFIDDSGVNSFSFTGYSEGQSGSAIVYSYKSIGQHKVYSETGIHSQSTFLNPENFNITSGDSFNFTGIESNNILLNSTLQGSGLIATGIASSNFLNVSYKLISPRNGDLISNYQDFEDEPFARSITGYFYDSSGYHFSLANIFSNNITHEYTGLSSNFYLHLETSDFYTGSSTGIVKFENEPPSVIDLASTQTTVSGSGNLNFFPSFSRGITGVHAFLYTDSALSSLDQSITTTTESNFKFSIPLNSSRFIKVIPYASFGSGAHFVDQVDYGIISNIDAVINTNKITLSKAVLSSGHRFADIYAYTNLNSYSGYHLDMSIYTGINVASNQYFSGSFNNDIDYLFDVTGSRNDKEEEFNVDVVLYESGNSAFLDSGNFSFLSHYPRITKTGFSEENTSDRQELDFTWSSSIPDFDSYLTFLISHSNLTQTGYSQKNISIPLSGSRTQELNISLVETTNTGNLFDSVTITGISLPPHITGISNVNERFFAPKFDQFLFKPLVSTNINSISGYKLFEKQSFIHDGSLTGLKDEVDSYPLSSDHLIQSLGNIEYVNVPSPESAAPQVTGIEFTGVDVTGFYKSGNIFNYNIVPFDHAGSGNPFSFDVEHGIANVTKVIRRDTDETIVNVTTVTSEVSNVGSNLSGVSGDVNAVSGIVDTVTANLSTVSGDLDSVNVDLTTISGRTEVLPTGDQVLSGSLNVTGDSHISGDLNVGRSEDNVLFSVHGTGSFINSNLSISGRLAVSGRMTLGGDPPTSSTNTGVFGQIAFDSQYFYVCTGTNKWGRVELSNW